MELVITNVKKRFGDKEVLRDATMSFEKGKIYGLLGRNGAGKTTLFNCISREVDLDGGDIRLIDEKNNSVKIGHSKIGYVFSEPVLPDFLTGYELIKFFIDVNRNDIEDIRTVEEYLDILKISKEDSQRLIKGYSHGMKNKLQMLCYFITKPPILLLDEPLTSFDVVVALEMKRLLREMKGDHILIFSTHIMQLAVDLCDEIVILNNGVLEKVENKILEDENFEDKIIGLLKEEEYV